MSTRERDVGRGFCKTRNDMLELGEGNRKGYGELAGTSSHVSWPRNAHHKREARSIIR